MNALLKIALTSLCVSACASMPAGNKAPQGYFSSNQALVYLLNNIGGVKIGGELMVVNGNEGGTLDRREYTWFHVPAGQVKLSFNDNMMKSRKLAARVFNVNAGSTYYIGYSLEGPPSSDATLIFEGLSGASDGNDNFNFQDIYLLTEREALENIKGYDLVGNKFESE